jgi:hypothetical protein
MYETSEYMREVADSIRGSLEEAMALYTTDSAISFEYQVNKWLGSLYSVGMSNAGVSAIGTAIGQIAAGDISGLGQGAANLVVMGANRAGLSIGDLLTKGLGND